MPVAAVTMLIETANLIGGNQNGKAWLDFFSKRKRLFLVVEIAILLVAPLGVNQTARVFPVSIPQPSPYFVPPFAGIRAFAEHYSGGRILATLAIGSMIDLFVNEKSSLYMDTRLDLYSKEAVEQYFTMIQAKKGWKDLLDHYQIDWVFLTPENQLSTELERDTGWTTVFKDKTASLFHRR
jgi:hypothetical protein